ncbi:hypothetical protein GUJ93_ZPchr0012g21639 [Zizania palustris]|uniref:Uncharacterized protein n=1 Tax=Zizania palustris TaxID=103762 RepID=A0A8J6BWX6_ZIZPA|nr:hypothetical protein GUJ93_ZPchr0012g21639 [Zizania palustris]
MERRGKLANGSDGGGGSKQDDDNLGQGCENAAIRYRKKRREALGMDAGEGAKLPKKKNTKREREGDHGAPLMVGFDKEVVLKQRRQMRWRRRPGEEVCVMYA